MWSACLPICAPCAWEPTCGGPTKGSGIGFIIEYFLIVINIAFVNLKIIKPKYPVACSRSVGAAGEQVLLWSMIWCCGGSACTQCLSCATPVVIGTSSMNETCDPVSIRGPGFRSGVQGPRSGFCDRWGLALQAFLVLGPSFDPGSRVPGPESRVPGSESKVPGLVFCDRWGYRSEHIHLAFRSHLGSSLELSCLPELGAVFFPCPVTRDRKSCSR